MESNLLYSKGYFMIKKILHSIILMSALLLFSSCSSDTSSANTTETQVEETETNTTINSVDSESQEDDTNTTQSTTDEGSDGSTTTSTVTTTNDDTLLRASAKIDDLVIKVHDNTFQTEDELYKELNQMLLDYTRMKESVTDRMTSEMQLLNTLAKPFAIADSYSSYFSLNSNYNATTPAFIINKTLTSNYFLLSSDTQFYLQGKSIKTYFKDTSTLANAWQRAITNADVNKDLYLTLLALSADGKVTRVTNSFIVKSATLKTY